MGSDEDPRDFDLSRRIFKNVLIGIEVTGILMILLLLIWAVKFGGGIGVFDGSPTEINLHIILMVISLVYFQGHAALMYRILPTQPKLSVKLLHGLIHLVVIFGMSIGLAAALSYHNLKGVAHFYTLHSWIGIVTIGFYYAQFIGGFTVFLFPGAPMAFRTRILPYHRVIGQTLFLFGCGAALSGVMLKAVGSLGDAYPKLEAPALALNVAGVLILIFAVMVNILLGEHRFRRRPRPEGELLLADTTHQQEQDEH